MPQLVSPHGSQTIKPLLLPYTERAAERQRAEKLRKIPLDSRAASDVFMLAMGAFTPLDGFMGYDNWRGSCLDMKLTNGVFWPIPITLSHDEEIAPGTEVALIADDSDEIMGTIKVTESYKIAKEFECKHVYTTTDAEHPGVKMVMDQKAWNIAGPVKVLSEGEFPDKFGDIYQRPAESRKGVRELLRQP